MQRYSPFIINDAGTDLSMNPRPMYRNDRSGQSLGNRELDYELSRVPHFFPALIVHLDLSRNSLGSVPDCVLQMVNLQRLDLHENFIDRIPVLLFSAVTKLQYLNLLNNNLSTIPDNIGLLVNLELLAIGYDQRKASYTNAIQKLPFSIRNCQKLVTIYIYGHKLTRFPQLSVFSNLKHVRVRPKIIYEQELADYIRVNDATFSYHQARSAVVTFLAMRKFRRTVWSGPYKDVICYLIAPMLYDTRDNDEWFTVQANPSK